jgi:hypothetical protein
VNAPAASSGAAGSGLPPSGGSRASWAAVHFLAVCNVIGFAVLFGFAGAGNFFLRRLVDAIEAPLSKSLADFLALPGWSWIVAFLAGSGLVAGLDRWVRSPAAGVLLQTAIGVVQLAGVTVYGVTWIAYLFPLVFP